MAGTIAISPGPEWAKTASLCWTCPRWKFRGHSSTPIRNAVQSITNQTYVNPPYTPPDVVNGSKRRGQTKSNPSRNAERQFSLLRSLGTFRLFWIPGLTASHKYGTLERVKTTLEIPDPIFRRAKSVAAQRGIPLRAFVTEAVTEKLEASVKTEEKPWVRLAGGLKHLHKETVRINRIIKSEFEKIEPEDWE